MWCISKQKLNFWREEAQIKHKFQYTKVDPPRVCYHFRALTSCSCCITWCLSSSGDCCCCCCRCCRGIWGGGAEGGMDGPLLRAPPGKWWEGVLPANNINAYKKKKKKKNRTQYKCLQKKKHNINAYKKKKKKKKKKTEHNINAYKNKTRLAQHCPWK